MESGFDFYFPIQIVKLKCKALSIKGFRGCVFIWATTGQQNPLKQVQVQHKERKNLLYSFFNHIFYSTSTFIIFFC